jgi:DNA repair protein RadC
VSSLVFQAEDSELPDNELIELVLRNMGLEYITKPAILMQKYYMTQPRSLYLVHNISVQQFEVIKILDQTKVPECHEVMVDANIDIFEVSYEESVSYFKRLENLEKSRHTNSPNPASLPVHNKTIYICYH